jgi:hypothetical protein
MAGLAIAYVGVGFLDETPATVACPVAATLLSADTKETGPKAGFILR